MISEHVEADSAIEPHDLQALQSRFDELKARFSIEDNKVEKAALAVLLLAAFRGSRNADQAAQMAAKIYSKRDLQGKLNAVTAVPGPEV